MDTENEIIIREGMARHEQDLSSVHKRLDNLEKLTQSVHVIATEIKAMREDVNDIYKRIDDIEKRPTQRYETIVTGIITAVIGAVIGFLIKK